jgi:hypothetical protein
MNRSDAYEIRPVVVTTEPDGTSVTPLEPAEQASVDEVAGTTMTIDITPVGCQTPEGAARVAKAMKEFEDSAASLANASIEFFDTHEKDILHCMTMYEGVAEDVHQIRALIGARRRKQGAFLRAVAGR